MTPRHPRQPRLGRIQAGNVGYYQAVLSGQVVREKVEKDLEEFHKAHVVQSKFSKLLAYMRQIKREEKTRRAGKTTATRNRKRNPGGNDGLAGVEEMTKQFHGRDPKVVEDITETEVYEDSLAELGKLLEFGVLSQDQKNRICINFRRPFPKLCCDAKGKNLQVIGGDQTLGFEGRQKLRTIGYCVSVAYRTDKHHLEDSNGSDEDFEHYFGEEFYKSKGYTGNKFFDAALDDGVVFEAAAKGFLPVLVYDSSNEKILIVGGRYKVKDVGIFN